MDELYHQLAALSKEYGAAKLVLFGSRARGDNGPRSDIDLAVYGMPAHRRGAFAAAVEELPTLLEFDLVHVTPGMEPVFLQNIEKDGIVLMGQFHDKLDKLQSTVTRLKESLAEYAQTPSSTMRDGVIQRFEFCAELSWKTLRQYLLDQGYTEINSPRATLRKGFAEGAIQDDSAWLSLMNDRNRTPHIYDEETAAEIFCHIQSDYVPLFDALISYLRG